MGVLVAKIVLTGGPCAGKTTTISRIEEHLNEKGYHVLVLNECATELIKGGIRPFGENALSVYNFQNEVLNLQVYKEKRYQDIIDKFDDSVKCILVSDRGVIDNKAYLGQELFDKLLEQNNVKEEDMLNEYDLVIHMITVASDIKNNYSNSTNTARFEDADEAIDLDKRTSDAWSKHPNMKVVPVTEILNDKIDIVLKHVDDLIEELDK